MIFLSQLEWYCVYWDKEMIAGRLRGSNGHQFLKTFVPFLANALNRPTCKDNSTGYFVFLAFRYRPAGTSGGRTEFEKRVGLI